MLKILNPPFLPLMVSEEAPRPVMVTAPTVPEPITALASIMFGNAELKVMVWGEAPVKLKLI